MSAFLLLGAALAVQCMVPFAEACKSCGGAGRKGGMKCFRCKGSGRK